MYTLERNHMSFPLKSTKYLKEPEGRRRAFETDATPLTFKSVIDKSTAMFGYAFAFMVVGWFAIPVIPPVLLFVGIGALVVLSIVVAFMRYVPLPLAFTILTLEGIFVGAISRMLETQYQNIVLQAVLGTVITLMVILGISRSGKFQMGTKGRKILTVVLLSYAGFSLVNLGLMLTGAIDDPWGLRGVEVFGIPLGLIIGVFAVVLGSITLLVELDDAKQAVHAGVPDKYGWQFGFGITMTIIWIYVEILRMIAIARN